MHGQHQAPGGPGQNHPDHGPQGQASPQGQVSPQGQAGSGQSNHGRPGQAAGRPIGPKAAAVAAGLAGGVLAATAASTIAQIHHDRHETHKGGIDVIREPGRTIIGEGGHNYIVHDENERFHDLGYSLRSERHGDEISSSYDRPDGSQIVTATDAQGRLLRRYRRFPDGREYVLIDNGYEGQVRDYHDDYVDLPLGPMGIPPDQYDVNADNANEDVLYDTLTAPPVQPLTQRYTLDQVLYSPSLRARMRSVDVNTLTFATGSWIVPTDEVGKLRVLADAVNKAVAQNPNEVFLVEGFTDAVGNPTDNLSLSDRRAQSVAALLTREFKVPPENLTTQGYGQQYPKEQTSGPSQINRRVVVQRITPLLADTGEAAAR
jgi:outer membrane protein OmpA-like peptidoglycan-associated protein